VVVCCRKKIHNKKKRNGGGGEEGRLPNHKLNSTYKITLSVTLSVKKSSHYMICLF